MYSEREILRSAGCATKFWSKTRQKNNMDKCDFMLYKNTVEQLKMLHSLLKILTIDF